MAPRKALATQAARKSAPATGGVKKPAGGNRKDITSSDSHQFSRESSRRSSRDVSPVQDAASATVVWLVPRIPGLSSPSTRISNIFSQGTSDSEEEGVGAAVVCKQVESPKVLNPKKLSKRQRKEEDVVVCKKVESPKVVNPKKLPKRQRKERESEEDERNVQSMALCLTGKSLGLSRKEDVCHRCTTNDKSKSS